MVRARGRKRKKKEKEKRQLTFVIARRKITEGKKGGGQGISVLSFSGREKDSGRQKGRKREKKGKKKVEGKKGSSSPPQMSFPFYKERKRAERDDTWQPAEFLSSPYQGVNSIYKKRKRKGGGRGRDVEVFLHSSA